MQLASASEEAVKEGGGEPQDDTPRREEDNCESKSKPSSSLQERK